NNCKLLVKTNILSQEASFLIPDLVSDNENKMQELEKLINYLLGNDHLTANDYIHIDDEFEGEITDKKILKIITNEKDKLMDEFVNETDETIKEVKKVTLKKAEVCMNKILKFLYEQEPEFGEINKEIKILRNLYRWVRLIAVKNLKQIDLHHFKT
ncbi:17030_t:CDS:2, partial [Funneliformis caledonium]